MISATDLKNKVKEIEIKRNERLKNNVKILIKLTGTYLESVKEISNNIIPVVLKREQDLNSFYSNSNDYISTITTEVELIDCKDLFSKELSKYGYSLSNYSVNNKTVTFDLGV